MNNPKLKLRKGKENSQTRQLKTEYLPKARQSSFTSNCPMFDKRSKPIEIKFIPMRGLHPAKKLITEPENSRKLNRSEKTAVEKIFLHESIKKRADRLVDSSHPIKRLTGKDRYAVIEQIGSGTFGTVYQARDQKTLETVAIKKVFQDKKYKNRQLQTLKIIDHPCILKMKDCFFTAEGDKQYLNVVTDYFSLNLYQLIGKYTRKTQFPRLLTKILAYQMLRGLLYLELEGIAHRDIKPQNVLVDQSSWKLVICDFGSAKKLKPGQPNIAYICSRSYRAPELIFGCTEYTTQIDMWSAACVLSQIVTVQPIFKAKSSSDHLLEVIKVFGSPTQQQIIGMNPKCNLSQFKFPVIPGRDLGKVLGRHNLGDEFTDLLKGIFKYSPKERLTPFQALSHPFFNELREETVFRNLQRQYPKLDLFNLKGTSERRIKGISQLIPNWY